MQLHSLDFCVAELFFRLSAPNTEELKQRLPSYAPFYIRQIPEHASMIFEARIADADIVVTGEGAMILNRKEKKSDNSTVAERTMPSIV